MKNTISDRICLLISELGYNKRTFSQAIGLGNDVTIGRIVNEQREPSYKVLNSIVQTFGNIDANWLLTGEGDIYRKAAGSSSENVQVNVQVDVQALEKNDSDNDEMLCKENAYLNAYPDAYLTKKEADLSSKKNGQANGHLDGNLTEKESDLSQRNVYPESNLTRPSVDIVSIPIVEISVAAGDGYYNGDALDVIDNIQLPQSMVKRGSQYFCVRVKGESMAPTLLDSSFLVIRLLDRGEWEYMPEEQVYVVTDRDGKAYVKRVKNRLDKGFIVCMSDNPDKAYYPNFNLQTDEIHTIWHAEWYISAKMPNIHQTYYTKVSHLEDEMAEMRNDIAILKSFFKH